MADLGYAALVVAFPTALYTAIISWMGGKGGKREWVESARRGTFALFALVSLAVLSLLYALLTRDFRLSYVANYTNRSLPIFYTLSALWGGQLGSLLFWTWLVTLFAALVARSFRGKRPDFLAFVLVTPSVVTGFFLTLLLFASNPFQRLSFMPVDGRGLNPLLQNPAMAVHPPTLYVGFVGFTIPFAFAIAALLTRQLDQEWVRNVRRWTLLSWLFLTMGNFFGAQWAYVELGWGGYWAWDPVENAALMPWLTATAFLHSIIVQERRGTLKMWNMVLVALTFLLTILGTFITRSGIVSSVHAFASSKLSPFFVIFMAGTVVVFSYLLITRAKQLKSESSMDFLLSRESSFVYNNIVLVGIALAVLWGTLFPLFSRAFSDAQITLGPPFFNRISVPGGIILLFLTGLCPVLAWRRTRGRDLAGLLPVPLLAAFFMGVLSYVLGLRHLWGLMTLALSAFTVTTIIMEFYRGVRARRQITREGIMPAFFRLIGKNRRRYGGYLVHLGVVLVFVGIAGSSIFQRESLATLQKGESLQVGPYRLVYQGLTGYRTKSHQVAVATIAVLREGKPLGHLFPEKRFYPNFEPNTEIALRISLLEDLYVILAGYEEGGKLATIRAFLNPLVIWIWIGGGVMVLGTLFALWPDSYRRASTPISEIHRASPRQ